VIKVWIIDTDSEICIIRIGCCDKRNSKKKDYMCITAKVTNEDGI
jgi:hypothetical protein